MDNRTRQVLEGAKKRVERGFVKKRLWDRGGSRYCMRGAVIAEIALGPGWEPHLYDSVLRTFSDTPEFVAMWHEAERLLRKVIQEQYPTEGYGITDFNNAEDTTQDDVVRIFEKTLAA